MRQYTRSNSAPDLLVPGEIVYHLRKRARGLPNQVRVYPLVQQGFVKCRHLKQGVTAPFFCAAVCVLYRRSRKKEVRADGDCQRSA